MSPTLRAAAPQARTRTPPCTTLLGTTVPAAPNLQSRIRNALARHGFCPHCCCHVLQPPTSVCAASNIVSTFPSTSATRLRAVLEPACLSSEFLIRISNPGFWTKLLRRKSSSNDTYIFLCEERRMYKIRRTARWPSSVSCTCNEPQVVHQTISLH